MDNDLEGRAQARPFSLHSVGHSRPNNCGKWLILADLSV